MWLRLPEFRPNTNHLPGVPCAGLRGGLRFFSSLVSSRNSSPQNDQPKRSIPSNLASHKECSCELHQFPPSTNPAASAPPATGSPPPSATKYPTANTSSPSPKSCAASSANAANSSPTSSTPPPIPFAIPSAPGSISPMENSEPSRRPHLRRLPHLPPTSPHPRSRRTLHARRPLPLHARRRPRPRHRTLPPPLPPHPAQCGFSCEYRISNLQFPCRPHKVPPCHAAFPGRGLDSIEGLLMNQPRKLAVSIRFVRGRSDVPSQCLRASHDFKL